jgi:hypothetical protein
MHVPAVSRRWRSQGQSSGAPDGVDHWLNHEAVLLANDTSELRSCLDRRDKSWGVTRLLIY